MNELKMNELEGSTTLRRKVSFHLNFEFMVQHKALNALPTGLSVEKQLTCMC